MRLSPSRPLQGTDHLARTSLPGNQLAAGAARRFLRAVLADWATQEPPGSAGPAGRGDPAGGRSGALRRADLVEDGTLLVSELVTNAVIHAGTTVDVLCRLDTAETPAGLVIEVCDQHPSQVLRGEGRPPAGTREGGRGLQLVAALSDAWGISYRRDRKTVWCRLDLAEGEEALDGVSDDAAGGRPVNGHPRPMPDRASAGPPVPGPDPAPAVPFPGSTAFPLPAARRGLPAADLLAPAPARSARRADADWVNRGSLSFLAEASDLLAGQLDEDTVASLATQLLVPRFADWCAVWLYPNAAPPRLSRVWHCSEHLIDALRGALEHAPPPPATLPPGVHPWPGPLDSGPPDSGPPGSGSLDFGHDHLGGSLAVPLIAAGRCHGALLLGRSGRLGLPAEVTGLVEDFARRVALAVRAARQYERQAMISSVLQRGLLPPAAGRIPGIEHAVVYEPMAGDWVGGDFYDLFPAGDGRWCFALGDVCGSGPEAASLTGIARPVLRLLAREGCPVADVLNRLNKALADEAATAVLGETATWDGGQSRFLSLLYGEIVPHDGRGGARCTLASAGHPLPLHLGSDGEVLAAARPQMLLGISDTVRYVSESFDLYPGETLLCVTDGVTERRRGDRQLDDDNGLNVVLAGCKGLSAAGVAERIRGAVHDYGEVPPDDDLAILVLQAR